MSRLDATALPPEVLSFRGGQLILTLKCSLEGSRGSVPDASILHRWALRHFLWMRCPFVLAKCLLFGRVPWKAPEVSISEAHISTAGRYGTSCGRVALSSWSIACSFDVCPGRLLGLVGQRLTRAPDVIITEAHICLEV